MKTFVINKTTEIVCWEYSTRYSWGHVAKLMVDGQEVDRCKIKYQNRTWESFEFESVIDDLLTKTKIIPEDQIKEYMDHWRKGNRDEILSTFRMIGTIAKVGTLFSDDKKEQINWKERMIKAGLGDSITMPDDWDELSDQEKESRLDKVIEELTK